MYTNDPDTIRDGAAPIDCDGRADGPGATSPAHDSADWLGLVLHTWFHFCEASPGVDCAGAGAMDQAPASEVARFCLDRLYLALRSRADSETIEAYLHACDLALERVNPDADTRRRYQQLAETAEALRISRLGRWG